MLLPNLVGLLSVILLVVMMFFFVPREEVRHLLPFGLTFGFGTAIILLLLMQNIYNFWQFIQTDFLYLFNIPLLISAAWIPTVIIFAHWVKNEVSFMRLLVTISLFAGGATLVHYFLIANQMLVYENWSLVLTFTVSFIIHVVITGYLYMVGRITKIGLT